MRQRECIGSAIVLTVLCLLIGLGAGARAAQDKDKAATENLVILATARELDQRCHALTADERRGLDTQIEVLLRTLEMSEAELKDTFKRNPSVNMKCDDKLAQFMFELVKRPPAKPTAKATAPAKSDADEDREAWEFVQQSWAKHFKEIPAGRLTAFDGCWSGLVEKVPFKVCLSGKGDVARVDVGGPGGLQCQFTGGGARQRQDFIMFYAPSATGKCSDGSVIQHTEGGCKPIAEDDMDCVITVFSRGNTIYQTKDGRAITGGDLRLTRAKR